MHMHTFHVIDVNEALPRGLAYLRDEGTPENTRNGPVLVAPGPVATVYADPRRRVLFDPERDANPFFHLFEAMWILAGRSDVRTLAWFNSRMADYSDDGYVFHAPYGHRLRVRHGDQIETVCEMLRANPFSRQAVLQLWDAGLDLNVASKDLPCNDMVMLRVVERGRHPSGKALDITVCCRSNDAIWGAYGANAVQFSFVQEYIASKIGVGVGKYVQMSHNFHVYTENPYWQTWASKNRSGVFVPPCAYDLWPGDGEVAHPSPLSTPQGAGCGDIDSLDRDLKTMFRIADGSEDFPDFANALRLGRFDSWFMTRVVVPMVFKYANRQKPVLLFRPTDIDWHAAGQAWIQRRAAAAAAKESRK